MVARLRKLKNVLFFELPKILIHYHIIHVQVVIMIGFKSLSDIHVNNTMRCYYISISPHVYSFQPDLLP